MALKGTNPIESKVEILFDYKPTHGGSRKGSGRKKLPEAKKKKSKVMRIPLDIVDKVEYLIEVNKNTTKP